MRIIGQKTGFESQVSANIDFVYIIILKQADAGIHTEKQLYLGEKANE